MFVHARKMISLESSAFSNVYMFAPYSQDVPIRSEFQSGDVFEYCMNPT